MVLGRAGTQSAQKLGADEAAAFSSICGTSRKKKDAYPLSGRPTKAENGATCFAGTEDRVPAVLLNRDVADCCLEHLAKLAQSILRVAEAFRINAVRRKR